MLVGRAHERHGAVARRPVDGDARLHEPLAQRVDVVDLEGEVPEMAGLAIVFAIPIEGELDQRRVAAGAFAVGDQIRIGRPRQEHEGVAVFLVDPPPYLGKTELVAIEIERGVEITNAQHGMKISHESLTKAAAREPLPRATLGTTLYICRARMDPRPRPPSPGCAN